MANSNRKNQQILSIAHSKTLSILPSVPVDYPRWLDELFVRMAFIYEGRWTHSIQDPRMLELKKAEWYDSLKEFDAEIIKETITDVKKLYAESRDSYPDIRQFYSIAKTKSRAKKALQEMAERERQKAQGKISKPRSDPELIAQARAEIRRICKIKSANPNNSPLREEEANEIET